MKAALVLASAAVSSPAMSQVECPPELVEPERVFAGIYTDEFEAQRFFEDAFELAAIDRRKRPQTWLIIDPVEQGDSLRH